MRRSFAFGLLILSASLAQASESSYLFVWAADADGNDSDFLAVVDAAPDSATYGKVLTTVEVGYPAAAHHTEHRMPEDGQLFLNGFKSGRSFVIDLRDPLQPSVASAFTTVGDFSFPHSFERLSNGNVIATFQNGKDGQVVTGGIVEMTTSGEQLRSASAAVAEFSEVRPYSLLPLPDLDRLLTTTTDMRGQVSADSVQFWRLSDLTLLKTVRLPEGPGGAENLWPAEPRRMPDSDTVLVNTFYCGLYQVHDVVTDNPSISHVYTFAELVEGETDNLCALPVVVGDYWIQTVPARTGLVAIDVSDPSNAKEVAYVNLGDGREPHWISLEPGGKRIVVTGYGEQLHSVTMVSVDPASGAMSIDRSFGENGVVSFARPDWPHGPSGAAVPHGSVFSNP